MAEKRGSGGAEPLRGDDSDLLKQAANGNTRAFHELVERHAAGLFRLACALTGNSADAEDVVQETFTGAFRALGRFEGRSSVRTWLGQILVHQAAALRRSNQVRRTSPLPMGETDDRLAVQGGEQQVDQQEDMAAALRKLSPEYRTVLVLREYEQMSYEEIAAALQIPRGTVESRLHRARQDLRTVLGDYKP